MEAQLMKKRYFKKTYFHLCSLLTLIFSCHITHGKDIKNIVLNTAFFALPGLHGGGSRPRYIKECLALDKTIKIIRVNYPKTWTTKDLAQQQCISHLDKPLKKDKTSNIVIHATSQGGGTALNYIAMVDQGKKIKALILEAPLISGNDAILYTLKSVMPGITNTPFSYYWLPYLAKIRFPWYCPSGIQTIKSVPQIPDIPIIIIHAKNAPQLSYAGSCALYYGLRAQGNNNVYLISTKSSRHVRILTKKPELQKVFQAILKKHNLLDNKKIDLKKISLAPYQPNLDQYKNLYKNLLSQEKWHERVFYGGTIAAAGTAVALTYYAGKKLYKKYVTCS